MTPVGAGKNASAVRYRRPQRIDRTKPHPPPTIARRQRVGMVLGMATVKVTVTLEKEQLAAIRMLVDSDRVDSVSGFVQHAVRVSLADVAGWGAMLGAALEQTGGALTAKERAWADSILRPPRRRRRKHRAA